MNLEGPLGSACGLLYPLISAVYRVDYPLSIGSKAKGYRHRPLGRWLHVTGMHTVVIHTVGYNGRSYWPSTYIFLVTLPSLRARQINHKIYNRVTVSVPEKITAKNCRATQEDALMWRRTLMWILYDVILLWRRGNRKHVSPWYNFLWDYLLVCVSVTHL